MNKYLKALDNFLDWVSSFLPAPLASYNSGMGESYVCAKVKFIKNIDGKNLSKVKVVKIIVSGGLSSIYEGDMIEVNHSSLSFL